MMHKPDPRVLVGAALTVGLAIGAGSTMVATSDDTPAPPTVAEVAQKSRTIEPRSKFDVSAHAKALEEAKAAQPGKRITDLVTEVSIAPGQLAVAGANFPRGARIESISLTGSAIGAFSTPGSACRDNGEWTWCEVTAVNTSQAAARLSALVEWEGPP